MTGLSSEAAMAAGGGLGADSGHGSYPASDLDQDRSLASVMAFLSDEIDHSSAMLRDLAACLSDVVITLNDDGDDRRSGSCLNNATQALQNEDRIQQRLSDLRRTLLLLEQRLQNGIWPPAVDLDRAIFDQLRLDEMRRAYALRAGMSEPTVTSERSVPSAGDVDLF